MNVGKKKRRLMFRRKRTLDPTIAIDYKQPEILRRFITDRGKIIPRRISGATAKQQREICRAVKRARYLALLPFSLSHPAEKNFATEMSAIAASAMGSSRMQRPRRDGPPSGGFREGGFRDSGSGMTRGGSDEQRDTPATGSNSKRGDY